MYGEECAKNEGKEDLKVEEKEGEVNDVCE